MINAAANRYPQKNLVSLEISAEITLRISNLSRMSRGLGNSSLKEQCVQRHRDLRACGICSRLGKIQEISLER